MTAKLPGTFAFFGVADERVLRLITEWRETNVVPVLRENRMTGDAYHCCDNASKQPDAFHAGARHARLLSISAHGDDNEVKACADKGDLYAPTVAATYVEVPGAVMHMVVCSALAGLGPSLVDDGKADAVIGYKTEFVLGVPNDFNDNVLPDAAVAALRCDSEVLFALAKGATTREAVKAAKAWAEAETARLDARAAKLTGDAFYEVVWQRANVSANAAALDLCGSEHARVTTGDPT